MRDVMNQRLDQEVLKRGLAPTRSQAENFIKLGSVKVNYKVITKPGFVVSRNDQIQLLTSEQYVSRAGLKLASVVRTLKVDFKDKIMLDVGSSTGGFTDYALQHGAQKVIAVDVGTDQLHFSLRTNPNVELHEKTDIRVFKTDQLIDIVVIDVSFISLKEILPAIKRLTQLETQVVAMVKPQFEAGHDLKHKGVIKNDRVRRDILKDFESWAKQDWVILDKADSEISGAKGNHERFYLMRKPR